MTAFRTAGPNCRDLAPPKGIGTMTRPPVTPIVRTELHHEVLRRLSSMILRGELPPGSRLNERRCCEQLQVSRTPLRQAVKVLAFDGLVELLPNRGAWIAPLSVAETAGTFEVLALLERRAARHAAKRLSDAAIQELYRMHEAMLAYSREHDSENQLQVDLRIHRTIVEAAGNPVLANVHEGLAKKVERARYLASMPADRVRRSMEEHEAIIQAIGARDSPGLAAALYVHCVNTSEAVVGAVRRYLDTLDGKPG
jgi:DNA-binding GntR family transcriptional regulator